MNAETRERVKAMLRVQLGGACDAMMDHGSSLREFVEVAEEVLEEFRKELREQVRGPDAH